ncbi:cellulose binding domain-containing protein [Paractinoplanes durhamensis]|uniref:Cellulose-binding protein II n=1 Tax=Paractinoplanes durhamensis TaxID=113563 RepID=A0ABQ3YWH0_9ACTN|nr:cellulose binding domain-containing protein [Actinoplanes durhamensis]GIE01937.1 cellulose-binding protein II [Actinoplanes durhamensis]
MASRIRPWLAAAVAAVAALFLLVVALPSAHADPVVGNATYFDALGSPYGGCGIPQAELDTQDFVALNVYNTPGDYNFYPRPVTDATKVGAWNNGLNCGRYVQVTLGDYCTGVNDGAQNQAFCRNGSWVADAYNGKTLTMIVADSCGDTNAWCRDDPNHLDLSKPSLSKFASDLLPDHWNNRHVSWEYVAPPAYSGDIKIGFLQGAQVYWPAIAVSHLANGIHGVEYLQGGSWVTAKMNGDMGQSYVIGGTASGSSSFQIRVRDVNNQLINNGRVYNFALPTVCGTQCSQAWTTASYSTSDGGVSTTSPTPQTTTSSPNPSPSVTTTPPATGACTATSAVTGSWNGGFQSNVTVKAGSTAITGWTVQWTFTGGETIGQMWSASYTTSGNTVTAKNVSWNGTLAAGASTSFGYTGSGTPAAVSVSCSTP